MEGTCRSLFQTGGKEGKRKENNLSLKAGEIGIAYFSSSNSALVRTWFYLVIWSYLREAGKDARYNQNTT